MIDRRKFVALLSAVPFIGKSMWAACLKNRSLLPLGYVQCNVCGEFNGTTEASNLSWNGSQHRQVKQSP